MKAAPGEDGSKLNATQKKKSFNIGSSEFWLWSEKRFVCWLWSYL